MWKKDIQLVMNSRFSSLSRVIILKVPQKCFGLLKIFPFVFEEQHFEWHWVTTLGWKRGWDVCRKITANSWELFLRKDNVSERDSQSSPFQKLKSFFGELCWKVNNYHSKTTVNPNYSKCQKDQHSVRYQQTILKSLSIMVVCSWKVKLYWRLYHLWESSSKTKRPFRVLPKSQALKYPKLFVCERSQTRSNFETQVSLVWKCLWSVLDKKTKSFSVLWLCSYCCSELLFGVQTVFSKNERKRTCL